MHHLLLFPAVRSRRLIAAQTLVFVQVLLSRVTPTLVGARSRPPGRGLRGQHGGPADNRGARRSDSLPANNSATVMCAIRSIFRARINGRSHDDDLAKALEVALVWVSKSPTSDEAVKNVKLLARASDMEGELAAAPFLLRANDARLTGLLLAAAGAVTTESADSSALVLLRANNAR